MPYLNGEPFVKRQPPSDLSMDEELFFLPTTLEVFRDYDDYFERTILVNSMTWTCSVCNRGPSTYKEAIACERSDYRQLSAFDNSLASGLLYIIAGARKQRLPELVELICGFASSRFFVGEEIEFQVADSNVRSFGVIDRVVLSQKRNQFEHSGVLTDSDVQKPAFLDALKLHYCVREHKKPDGTNHISASVLVPGSIIHRRNRNVLARDHIKFFIRHTCELKNGIFTPKTSIMQRYKLYPYGPVTWAKLFLPPEPRWSELTPAPPQVSINRTVASFPKESNRPLCQGFKIIDTFVDDKSSRGQSKLSGSVPGSTTFKHNMTPSAGTTTRVQYFEPLSFQSQKVLYQQTHTIMSGAHTMNGSLNQTLPLSTCDLPRSLKVERNELEKEWSMVRRREDLELSDLVPLPEFTKFPSSLSPDDLGSAIQLLEFFHVFGAYIGLVVPRTSKSSELNSTALERSTFPPSCSSLTLSVLESSLLESDPCGPLADFFITMLSTIRRLELEASSRQPNPNASAATIAAASAVAAAEAGFAVNTQVSHVSGTGIDYSSLYDEDSASPEDSALFRVLREAGTSTRLCELVGIPTQAATIAAGKAAVAASVALNTTGGTAVKEDISGSSSSVCLNAVSRNSVTRAATTAVIAGAASLPPLDRAGLTEALWLHITSAAAKGGGWRGQIWGGTRPLDDPSVMLSRSNVGLVEKLKTVSVYELTPHEKLVLLTSLMDELLLQPQIRERMEDQYERVRLLRNQLRTVQADRSQLVSSNFVTDEEQEVLSHMKKISATSDGRAHSIPLGLKGRVNRGRGRPVGRKNTQPDSLITPLETYLSNNDYTVINQKTNRSDFDTATSASSASSTVNTIHEKLAESLLEEQKLLDAITQVSRGCSMVPLGQDRFYRQYWLVMSIPCILIEDCSCTDKNPYYTHATIRNRQIVYTYPELAKRMGLSSPEDACKRFREAICFIKDNESVDREELTFRIAATIPHQSSSSGSLPLEQLRALVKPERVGIHDSTSHNTCPVVSQLAKLRCSAAKQSAPSTVWSVLLPDRYNELCRKKLLNTRNRTANSTLNSGPSSSTLDCSSTIAVKSEECANDNVITSNESKCKKHISNDDDNESLSTKNDETDLIERAKWTVDCLEASLNPRGVRESRLRKTIGQLRPLLIKVVAMCPLELICSLNNNNPSGLDDKIAVVPQNTPVSTESATITDEMCRSEKSPESIMCSWLETALVGIGYRLGRLNLIKDLLFDRDYKPKEIPSEDLAELKQAPTEIPPNKNSDEADNDVVSSSTENANIADNSSKRFQTSEPVLNSSGLNMNVRRLAKILLSLGHDVSPKAVAGPMANNERTLRGGPVGTPSGKQSADLENILSETPPSSEINDSTSNSNMVQPLRTTGWQRWCISVEQASSTSQLHLLARALERGALRAALGGRGVSSAISNYVSQHPLPTLKCTLCRGPPDVHYLSTAYGNLSAFSVCSGCACPYHLDCLINPSNRRTSIRKPSRPRHSDISASNSPVSNNIDTPLTGFISNHSSLSSITSARLEVTGGSVVLCAFCLRSAGVLSSVTDNDTRLPHPNNQAYELSTTLVYSNEDYVCPNENVLRPKKSNLIGRKRSSLVPDESDGSSSNNENSDEKIDNNLENVDNSDVDESVNSHHEATTHLDSVYTIKRRGRPRRFHRVNTHRGRHSTRSVLENLNDCDEVHNSITEATCFSPKSLDVSSIDKLCVTVDVHYDDEVEQLLRPYNQRKKPKEHSKSLSTEVEGNCRLKRASIILDNCAPQITNTRDRGRRSYRGRPRKPDIPISSPSSDIPDPIPPLSSNQSQFDQATAERFLTELCMSSSARPLLRCGLGRTVALGELNQSNGDLETDFMPITTIERSRTSHRTRSTTSSSHNAEDRRLYAYDLVGLKELLSRGELPRGPGQVISQLKLLLSHWLRSNRPGSRLHQCASDLLEQMNKKLKLLQSNTVPINGIINSNIGSNDDNLGIVEQHIQTLDTTGHYGKRRRQ